MRVRVHVLKCWPEPFAALLDGSKRHEVRRDDRGYMVGDVLCLHEWEPRCRAVYWPEARRAHERWSGTEFTGGQRTGRVLYFRVTHKTPGGSWGLPLDLCVLSIERAEEPVHAD